jgi:hypothetical protein
LASAARELGEKLAAQATLIEELESTNISLTRQLTETEHRAGTTSENLKAITASLEVIIGEREL